MKKMNSKKGFTLIELLIVIAIIAVLAVAFLPTILGAPAKGRDTARIANLQKIQKVIVSADLDNTSKYLTNAAVTGGCITDATFAIYKSSFGGTVPVDPQTTSAAVVVNTITGCVGKFTYVNTPATGYNFGVYAKMETKEAGNSICTELAGAAGGATMNKPTAATDSCYAVLTQ